MPLPPLPDDAVSIGAPAEDWRAAIRQAGAALERSGAATAAYAERMIEVVDEYGAYIVIAPGLALAHARPGPDVLADGLAVVTLAEPVVFGHPHNDPVGVVLGLAVGASDDHIAAVAELANVFNDESAIPRLAAARSVAEVQQLFRKEEAR